MYTKLIYFNSTNVYSTNALFRDGIPLLSVPVHYFLPHLIEIEIKMMAENFN